MFYLHILLQINKIIAIIPTIIFPILREFVGLLRLISHNEGSNKVLMANIKNQITNTQQMIANIIIKVKET